MEVRNEKSVRHGDLVGVMTFKIKSPSVEYRLRCMWAYLEQDGFLYLGDWVIRVSKIARYISLQHLSCTPQIAEQDVQPRLHWTELVCIMFQTGPFIYAVHFNRLQLWVDSVLRISLQTSSAQESHKTSYSEVLGGNNLYFFLSAVLEMVYIKPLYSVVLI